MGTRVDLGGATGAAAMPGRTGMAGRGVAPGAMAAPPGGAPGAGIPGNRIAGAPGGAPKGTIIGSGTPPGCTPSRPEAEASTSSWRITMNSFAVESPLTTAAKSAEKARNTIRYGVETMVKFVATEFVRWAKSVSRSGPPGSPL
ncbi:MAG: hypothetical protein B9S33_00790 [Pedosphaera sp. Tous-C6FEB]|nr:MAG: hypothetical protein B9S33_00790 [Pedosphaera sp. Tous-C6FEB]